MNERQRKTGKHFTVFFLFKSCRAGYGQLSQIDLLECVQCCSPVVWQTKSIGVSIENGQPPLWKGYFLVCDLMPYLRSCIYPCVWVVVHWSLRTKRSSCEGKGVASPFNVPGFHVSIENIKEFIKSRRKTASISLIALLHTVSNMMFHIYRQKHAKCLWRKKLCVCVHVCVSPVDNCLPCCN